MLGSRMNKRLGSAIIVNKPACPLLPTDRQVTSPDAIMPSSRLPGLPQSRPISALMPIASATILWTECLHGQGSLRTALGAIADALSAEGALLLRATATPRRSVRILSHIDRQAARGADPLPQPLGPDLIGVAPSRIRPGSLWSLMEAGTLPALRLEARQSRWLEIRGITEVVVIALGPEGDAMDLLELHLTHRLTPAQRSRLADLAEALTFAWGRRPEGRVVRMLSDAPAIAQRLGAPPPPAGPLSVANPWRLTPTEMRICGLIRDGLAVTDIVDKIGVAESTLRSHLRNIYAKAGVSGQVGLLRSLLDEPSARFA